MKRSVLIALGVVAGLIPVAARTQDPPISMPNGRWNDLVPFGTPSRLEREFSFQVVGGGVPQASNLNFNLSLARELRAAIAEALASQSLDNSDVWKAPPLVGAFYSQTSVSRFAFLDRYYDTAGALPSAGANMNFYKRAEYRERARFDNMATANLYLDFPDSSAHTTRFEIQSKVDLQIAPDGFRTVHETRLEFRDNSVAGEEPGNVRDWARFVPFLQSGIFPDNTGPGTFEDRLIIASPHLVEFLQRDPNLAAASFTYVPKVISLAARDRHHLRIRLPEQASAEEAFIISVDEVSIFDAGPFQDFMNGIAPRPMAKGVFRKIDVDFERNTADLVEGNAERLAAFLADLRTIVSAIRRRLEKISTDHKDAAFLQLVPATEDVYNQGLKLCFFIRGDASGDGFVDSSDAIYILHQLFLGTGVPQTAAFDVNGDGRVDLSDPIYLLRFLFLGGPPPPVPFPGWGRTP